MTLTPAADEEFTELVDADIPRVDLVGKAANGTQFFIAKQAAPDDASRGLFAPDFVRDLIAKSEPTTQPQETVTMTGSLAAIAALIHNAPVRKAEPADDVQKADGMDEDLDPTVVLAEPDAAVPGDPDEPGSPAWEAVDAATACKWLSILGRVGHALAVMAAREMAEAETGDDGAAMSAIDLEDATCAIDYAVSVLAPYAAGEHAEASIGAEVLAAVGKALTGFDTAPLELVEGLAPVAKAGRVLSAHNESAIRGAVEALQQVLASLPAPVDESGQPVAKQTQEIVMQTATVTETAPAETAVAVTEAPDAPAAEVVKAKTDPKVAVYTADGVLFGVVDPGAVAPITAPEAPEGAAEEAAEEAAEAPVIADGEDAEVIPGTSTVASPAADEDEIMKAAAQAGFGPLLAEALAPIAEQLARHAGLADVVKGLQEQVENLARMPDDRKSPLLNGATGTAGIADRDGAQADPLADLKKAVAEATDPGALRDAKSALAYAEIKARFAQ